MKSLVLFTIFLLATVTNAQTFSSVRELSEINNPNQTDAYPYITNDGLRLYFTSYDANANNLYYTSRPNLNSDFAQPQAVDITLFSGLLSAWFTTDELEIYYTDGSNLYHATRATTSSSFSTPVPITLVGTNATFISGPSLTPNAEELYLYDGSGLMKFEYANTNEYTFVAEVAPLSGYEGSSGQLSKDGLKLFWSHKAVGADSSMLVVSERTTIGDDFLNSVPMSPLLNSSDLINSQPSYATSANVMVWVRNNQPLWQTNQLYLADDSAAFVEELNGDQPKELVKIVDLMGRETQFVPGVVLIYVYSDGSNEKRFVMK